MLYTTSRKESLQKLLLFSVGDHSGSHSERYELHVGHVQHQSPGYGLVGSDVYTFQIGTYPVSIIHRGTNRGSQGPDYDYTAHLVQVGGNAKMTLSGAIGKMPASFFYRWATLNPNTVKSKSGLFEVFWKSNLFLSCVKLHA